MTKQEFLAASLPYKLKLKAPCGFRPNGKESTGVSGIVFLAGDLYADIENKTFSEEFIPIIRPIDSLTNKCVQTDYNDGKPFIPIKELERLFPIWCLYLLDDNGKTVVGFHQCDYDGDVTIEDMMLIIQQLLKWHFWLNKPESEEVVYVSESFNPYK